MANIQNAFLKFIRSSENRPSVAEVREFFNQIDTEHPEIMSLFNKRETGIFDQIVSEVIKKYEVTRKYEEMYEGRPEEFFEALFGKKPVGKIEVEALPMGLLVKCYDPRDIEKYMKPNTTTHGLYLGDQINIKELFNLVILENVSAHDINRSRYTIKHEEGHIFNHIVMSKFEENIGDKFYDTWKEMLDLKVSNGSLDIRREKAEKIAKKILQLRFKYFYEGFLADEILATAQSGYYKDAGTFYEKISAQGGNYDFIDMGRKNIPIFLKKNGYPGFVIDAIEYAFGPGSEKLRKRQNKLIKEGIEAINKLKETHGIDGAIAILDKEPLHRWPKVVERIEEEDVLGLNKEPRV